MDSLENLDAELAALRAERGGVTALGARPPKLRYSHEALIDLMIAQPTLTQNQLADRFGYTPAWISTIITSDAFQAQLAARRKAVVDPILCATVEEQFKAVTQRSLTILQEKLNRPAVEIPDQLAIQSLAIAAKAAGFGARTDLPQSPVSVHVHLNEMAGNLRNLLQREKSLISAPVPDPDDQ